ncbi:MAG: CpaF family protein [Acidimicrobiales bacterium]
MTAVPVRHEVSTRREELAALVHDWVLDQVGRGTEPTAAEIARRVHDQDPLLGASEVADVLERLRARVEGLGPLEPLLADPQVTEIMVGGPGGAVSVERRGRVEATGLEIGDATTHHLLQRIVSRLGRRIDRASPLVDARLPDGSRVAGALPPVAIDGPVLAIRRFPGEPIPLSAFGDETVTGRLRDAVRVRQTIVISGGTSTGKTSLLNALGASLPADERVVTIEEAAELRLAHPHLVRLEAQPPNADGHGAVTVAELVRVSLRLRPDRLIIGEVRGAEAFDLLQALNTGHAGSLTTVHANDPDGALRRLETLALTGAHRWSPSAAREHVAAGVDLVVQLVRSADGERSIADIVRVRDDHTTRTSALGAGA